MTPNLQPHTDPAASFRRLMLWTGVAAFLAIVGALVYLALTGVAMPWHMIIATVLGVGFTVLLGGGLMALVFLSANSGRDDEVR
ncbi:hypothetical protein [Sphingosinicella humi]|uniref:Uncharacterized protein n=1 Tax=Allosphingosinicella humi TaxID=2068657 RepID=A0A2U2J162_9SPHN|nr:hypothetical protein [Sphingosinicella humi]PWG02063.1 hypothetical protein DF286_03650 [Sphingosinicella humi]